MINPYSIIQHMFLKTNRNWTLKLASFSVVDDTYTIILDNGTQVKTTLEIYQTISRNFSEDWLEITYPNGYVKSYRLK